MKRKRLKTVSFDGYLTDYFFAFVRKPKNHIQVGHFQYQLKSDSEFSFLNAPNRNKAVASEVWEDLIAAHIHRYNYN